MSKSSKEFSSEMTEPISIKFYIQPPSKGGKKVDIIFLFGPGHMVGMPIYVKNLNKSSSPEPLDRLP